MIEMRRYAWLISLAGLGSLCLGLLYVNHAFGPTEAEVVTWGRVAVGLGVVLLTLGLTGAVGANGVVKAIAALLATALILLQLLPIQLWWAFHGSGISDGTPPSSFVAHWGYSVPHLGVLLLGVAVLWRLFKPYAGGQNA